jgi:hypothetical protein|tara:strand:+ start:73 stop:465 length:393 start_codon:yes stop_codon:yes gene_type:complete
MSNPFDYVKAVSDTKKDLMRGTENDTLAERGYQPFLANKALSYHPDAILHANEMNMLHHLDKKLQFDYYHSVLRRRKRFAKWSKPEDDENINIISSYYGCNKQVALQYLKILSTDQIGRIKQKQEKGGVK